MQKFICNICGYPTLIDLLAMRQEPQVLIFVMFAVKSLVQ